MPALCGPRIMFKYSVRTIFTRGIALVTAIEVLAVYESNSEKASTRVCVCVSVCIGQSETGSSQGPTFGHRVVVVVVMAARSRCIKGKRLTQCMCLFLCVYKIMNAS